MESRYRNEALSISQQDEFWGEIRLSRLKNHISLARFTETFHRPESQICSIREAFGPISMEFWVVYDLQPVWISISFNSKPQLLIFGRSVIENVLFHSWAVAAIIRHAIYLIRTLLRRRRAPHHPSSVSFPDIQLIHSIFICVFQLITRCPLSWSTCLHLSACQIDEKLLNM